MAETMTQGSVISCPDCSRPLMNVGKYAGCVYGCKVGLFPKLSPDQHKVGAEAFKRSKMPIAQIVFGIEAAESDADHADRHLYVIEGHPGVFRRVVMNTKGNGIITAVLIDASIRAFRQDPAVEAAIGQFGLMHY